LFASIDALEELALRNFNQDELDILLRGTDSIARHWRALKTLHVSFCEYRAKGLTSADVCNVVADCPDLRDVDIKIAMERDHDIGYNAKIWVRLPSLSPRFTCANISLPPASGGCLRAQQIAEACKPYNRTPCRWTVLRVPPGFGAPY
jgi:hypothetical protein